MKNYRLHYAQLHDFESIPCYEFKTFEEVVGFSMSTSRINKGRAVYLIVKDFETTFPFVTDNPFDIEYILTKMPGMGFKSDTFIQEYNSFEEAYRVALTMVENKSLCYTLISE